MRSETKEVEAGPANLRHSRDHSRDPLYTTDLDTIYASTRTLKNPQFSLENELRAKPAHLATTGLYLNHSV